MIMVRWAFFFLAVSWAMLGCAAGEESADSNIVEADPSDPTTTDEPEVETDVTDANDANDSTSPDDASDSPSSGPVCGNGLVEEGEACDDGNTLDTDSCLTTCIAASCGDGFVWEGQEECDDGNTVDTDSCLTTCIAASCGDGFVWEGQEECDDDNTVDTDSCLTTCIAASCGDGFVWEGQEECDDGNAAETDSCLTTCVPASCGDGFVWEGQEECDDGNAIETDSCLTTCIAASCGDGFIWEEEEFCDDGELNEVGERACVEECSRIRYWVEADCRDDLVSTGQSVGDISSDFESVSQYGDPVRLYNFCDRHVLIVPALGWSFPCVEAAQMVAQWYEDYKDQGLMVVTLLAEADTGALPTVEQLMAWDLDYGADHPVLVDPSYEINQTYCAETCDFYGMHLIGPGGEILGIDIEYTREEIESILGVDSP